MSTNITARQDQYASEMQQAFTDEQLTVFGDYFQRYNDYLKIISGTKPVQIITDANLLAMFRNAIIDYTPRAIYKCEPLRYFNIKLMLFFYLRNSIWNSFGSSFRYTIYHHLFKWSPIYLRDLLIIQFVNMPKY